MKFNNFKGFVGLIVAIAIVSSTSPQSAFVAATWEDGQDSPIPQMTFGGIVQFFEDYIRLCNELKHKRYNRIIHRQERGPLKFEAKYDD